MKLKTIIFATISFVLLAGCGEPPPPAPQASNDSQELEAFIDDFVSLQENETPTDLSAASFAEELRQTKAHLARLRSIDTSTLSNDEQIDWEFAQSILRGQEITQESIQSWKKDPRVYMQFRNIGIVIGQPGDAEEKADALLDILRSIPVQLNNGQQNLEVYIPRFQELSVFMAEGAISLFENDVPVFADSVPGRREELLNSSQDARIALESYIEFLESELPQRPRGQWEIGTETYDALLKDQYLLPYDSDELFEFGLREFERTVSELEELAQQIDPTRTWQELIVEIKNDYPDPQDMIDVHQEWVDKSQDHFLSLNLLPIPWEQRVDVVPRAEYLRRLSYYGHFSRARQANDEGVFVAEWMINPFEEQWDEQTKAEYLVEHDYGVIIVTAPHETYGGHHVQSLYQMHNPSRLRRTNGISIFSEGWGLYNEQLMRETGFFPNDRIVLRQLQLRLWRNARVVWDVGIHTGQMSYEEAIALLSDGVGFLRWAAQLEIDGSAESPVYKIGYFLGMYEILEMREEYRDRMGDRYSLSEFHERLLEVGNMPLALMRKGLMAAISDPD
ncbi:MAG: DUF885 domain-containing protein [Rhodospirillaceae bacterium]|nr:DUF885 domain-containing protein [Rhodospirillaceae bacterium]